MQNVGQLIAGRILNGITVGITSSQVPVYLAEIARKEKRGSLIIIQQLAIGKCLEFELCVAFLYGVLTCLGSPEWGILFMFFIGVSGSLIIIDVNESSSLLNYVLSMVAPSLEDRKPPFPSDSPGEHNSSHVSS